MKIDIKEIGVPNICFSTADIKDRKKKKQRQERGFDDTETETLYYTFACFMLPRLARYIMLDESFNFRDKEQVRKIKQLYIALQLIIKEKTLKITDKEAEAIKRGIKILPDIFFTLWRNP